jgi:hypothetical protein
MTRTEFIAETCLRLVTPEMVLDYVPELVATARALAQKLEDDGEAPWMDMGDCRPAMCAHQIDGLDNTVCWQRTKDNRFACVLCGEIRDHLRAETEPE